LKQPREASRRDSAGYALWKFAQNPAGIRDVAVCRCLTKIAS
jgi:hypothetical protein